MGGWAIALHGGAGDIPRSMPPERLKPRDAALHYGLQIGVDALKAGQTPLDVVELVVRELENNPHFNAGKGSVLTSNGTVLRWKLASWMETRRDVELFLVSLQ